MRVAPLCAADELSGLFEVLQDRVGRRGVAFFEGVRMGSTLGNLLTVKGSPVHSYFHVIPFGPLYSRRLIELPVSSTFEDYLDTLGSSVRQDIRRTQRNLKAKLGSNVRTIRYDKPEQMESLADAIAHISRKSYQSHLLGIGLDNTPEQVAKCYRGGKQWLATRLRALDGKYPNCLPAGLLCKWSLLFPSYRLRSKPEKTSARNILVNGCTDGSIYRRDCFCGFSVWRQ